MHRPSRQQALVTGASGAIGGAIAARLAAAGTDLMLAGRDRGRLEALAARLRSAECRIDLYVADLDGEAAAAQLAGRTLAFCRELDLLVLAHGHFAAGSVAEDPLAALDRQLAVNLRAPWALTHHLLPSLRARRGQIAFVNSSAALAPRAGVAAYAASKAALRAFADALRDEVNPQGIRVLSVFPGRTASAMQEALCRASGLDYQPERLLQPDDVAAALLAALALPRTAEVTDLHLRPMLK